MQTKETRLPVELTQLETKATTSNTPVPAHHSYPCQLQTFIRAETIAYEDYVALEGEQKSKEAGKMRVEGKSYIVKDGDVLHFLFNA